MTDYSFDPTDGKIHCRYSQLVRCTPKQIDCVLAEIRGLQSFEGEAMAFGTERHQKWAEESIRTSRPYHKFDRSQWIVTSVEEELATEILPGVVLHSRPDFISELSRLIGDYKTATGRKDLSQYQSMSKKRQIITYAFQAGMHGIHITKGAFLCEIWNKERDTILGYEVIEFPISVFDIAGVLAWLRQRATFLAAAIEMS